MTTGSDRVPSAPKGTGPAGRALWRDVVGTFELDAAELGLLREAVRTTDALDALNAVVAADGVLDPTTGKAHPALVEARQQRMALARLVASLRLPDDNDDRAQRRGAARGTYNGRRCGMYSIGPHAAS